MSSIQFKQLTAGLCRHGTMVWPAVDAVIGRALNLYGEFAEGENRLMARYVNRGDTVVDVGANLGTTVLSLSRAVGLDGKVIAFEPQPLMAQCLQTSLTLNEQFNVRLITAALGNHAGWAKIPAPDITHGGNYGAMALSESGLQVPVMRLDDLELMECALLKIDVEGYEWPVIQGAQQHLLRLRPLLYLEAKRIAGTVAYLDWLLNNGWRCYWHFAHFYRADNFRNNPENIFGGTGDMNILAVPEEAAQPSDLPEISTPQEDWRNVYAAYFTERHRPLTSASS